SAGFAFMLNSITEIDGLFGRQASGLLSQEGDRVGQDLVAAIELNAIARVGQDLDHKAFELDEFFLGHFFIDAQVPEKAITTLTRGFPLSSVSSCTWTRIITSGFFARAFAHSCSIISNFSLSVSICCINIPLSLPKIQSICLAVSSESGHDRRMIAIAFLFVRLLYDCFKSRLADRECAGKSQPVRSFTYPRSLGILEIRHAPATFLLARWLKAPWYRRARF